LEGDQPPYRAGELLQTAATVAAIALALATLTEKRGPDVDGYYLIPTTLLFAGFLAVVGSLYAMDDLRSEVMSASRDPLGIRLLQSGPNSLFFTMWGLYVTGAAYIWILIDGVP
jgi:hypothetical protein